MRKITQESVNAFLDGRKFSKGNMTVELWMNEIELRLHGNLIARMDADERNIFVSFAGWNSVTTKERLNGLAKFAFNQKPFYIRNSELFAQSDAGAIRAIDLNSWYSLRELCGN
jgi:hypothetical protein